nr:hypothetical protein [Kibdelosporangium sp. MJ126-NF4]CTQ88857.1 hypothetical protein [Kibdelosporangium sp. MJ126-NF4]
MAGAALSGAISSSVVIVILGFAGAGEPVGSRQGKVPGTMREKSQ